MPTTLPPSFGTKAAVLSEEGLPPGNLIARLSDTPGQMVTLLWLGQAGFIIEGGGRRVVIDPYLSDHLAVKYANGPYSHERLMTPPVAPGAIGHVDAVLITHGHSDHLDPGTLPALMEANPQAVMVAPAAIRDLALARSGIAADRLRPIDAGETLDLCTGLTVTATRAAHEKLETDAAGRHQFLGFRVGIHGARIFHSVDTIPYEGHIRSPRSVRWLPIWRCCRSMAGTPRGRPGGLPAT